MGECFFWYRPTWVVPDQRPLNGRCFFLIRDGTVRFFVIFSETSDLKKRFTFEGGRRTSSTSAVAEGQRSALPIDNLDNFAQMFANERYFTYRKWEAFVLP